jgi:hypothetical protein
MEVEYAPTEEEIKAGDPAPPSVRFTAEPLLPAQPGDFFSPLLSPLAIAAAAFAIVAGVIWVGQQMTHAAGQTGYVRAIDREESTNPTEAGADAFRVAPVGIGIGTPVRQAPMPPPRPISRTLVVGPFLGDENRASARASLLPVHDMMKLLHAYDGAPLWSVAVPAGPSGPPEPSVTMPVGGVAPLLFPENPNAALRATRGATLQNAAAMQPAGPPAAALEVAIERLHNRTDALGTQANLCLTADQYPPPLQPGVKTVLREIHSYLKDADLAATDPVNAGALRVQATRRLNHAQAVVQYMDGLIDGTVDPDSTPAP